LYYSYNYNLTLKDVVLTTGGHPSYNRDWT